MKIFKISNILLLQLITCFTVSCVWESRIVFNEVVHDFGRAEQDRVLEHDFCYNNTGNRNLKIMKLHTG